MSKQSELDRWCVAFLDGDMSAGQFKRAIHDWHKQEIANARINEGQMFREAMINHSTPAIYWGKRLDELTLKEHKEQ